MFGLNGLARDVAAYNTANATRRMAKAARQANAAGDVQGAYQQRWREGQVSLVAALRAGRQTLGGARAHLAGIRGRPGVDGWYDGQRDLVARLQDGRLTLKAAALNLGMIAPGEE